MTLENSVHCIIWCKHHIINKNVAFGRSSTKASIAATHPGTKLNVYSSRKHIYIILIPLNPTFYIVKLGFTVVYIIFLISLKNIDCGYSLEPPRRGGSNEYPQSMFGAGIWKISDFFV